MACERWREMLSAQLDGEDDPVARPLVDEHLAGCAACREWLDRAAAVNRLTRTSVPVAPDLSAAIMAALHTGAGPGVGATADERAMAGGRGAAGWRGWAARLANRVPGLPDGRLPGLLFVALAVVGAVQLILGLGQVGGGVAGVHSHDGLGATPGHLWHESAAWNVAVGAGYLFIALRRSRPSGLVPMLTAFVGMLLLLSVNDLTGERVDGTRLVSHGFVIIGYLLVVALSRMTGGFATPPGRRSVDGTGWRARFADEGDDRAAAAYPGLRLVPRGPLTAEHTDQRAA